MAYLLHDAAGRLVKEGNKSYTYAWLDKLVSVTEAGKVSANFDYHPDGQIASVTYADGRRENYLWDGLALIHRNGTDILNEPAITGGNPVLSGDKVLFNDLLGNTLGVKDQSSYQPIRMTAFGESDNADAFFTGKPLVGELGYTFLFRNYRPEQGKWQTSDPLGYPDGWNNLAYVNNGVTTAIDWLGAALIQHETYKSSTRVLFSNSDYSISASYEVVVGSGDDKNATQTASISVNAHFTFTEKNLLFPDESVSVSLSLGGGSVTAKSDKQEIETISYSCSATKPEGNPYATAAGLGSASESSIHGSFYGYIYVK